MVVGAPLVAVEPVQHAPDCVIGTLGDGGEEDDDEADDSSEGGYTMDEVAKHNKKGDVWVVLNGLFSNVSIFLLQDFGGELAILTLAGTDATAEVGMIHPLDVVEKYGPDAIIGVAGSGMAKMAKGSAKSALLVATDKGDAVANLEAWRDWRMEAFDATPGVLLVNVRSHVNACYYLVLSISYEICATIFSAKNYKISNDRADLQEVLFFDVLHRCCSRRRKSSRVQGTRRLQRVRLFPRALVLDRIRSPGKHRRGVCVVERLVAHLCWTEANVGPETVSGIDERSNVFGYHWFHVAHFGTQVG